MITEGKVNAGPHVNVIALLICPSAVGKEGS